MVITYVYIKCPRCGETYNYPNLGYYFDCPNCAKYYHNCDTSN